MKNLIISAVGDESLHGEWMAGSANFDLCLIYYGNNNEVATNYAQQSTYFLRAAGMKYHLLSNWITNNPSIIRPQGTAT